MYNLELMKDREKSNRGFAAMDPEKQREIASKGGTNAHEMGVAHEFTPEEAREAGKKGGTALAKIPGHMAKIGSEGGKKSRGGGRPRKD